MKKVKQIVSLLMIVAVVFSTLVFTSCGAVLSQNPERPDYIPEAGTSTYEDSDQYTVVYQSDKLMFEFNEFTTDIRISTLENGQVSHSWSTEYKADESEWTLPERGQILNINYVDTSSGNVSTLSTFTDSVEKGQFDYTIEDSQVTVQYGLGDVGYKILFPLALSPERYAELQERLNQAVADGAFADDTDNLVANWVDYQLVDLESDVYSDRTPSEMNELRATYKQAAENEGGWYYLNMSWSSRNVDRYNSLFERIGYTQEECDEDNAQMEVPVEFQTRPEFNIVVNYKIVNDALVVTIPEENIYYPEDYIIETIQVNNNLMKYSQYYDGYFLLPDGSGSIMNFNNNRNKLGNKETYIQMYGVDDSRGVEERTAVYNDAVFPVFGSCVTGYNPPADTTSDLTTDPTVNTADDTQTDTTANADAATATDTTANNASAGAQTSSVDDYYGAFAVINSGDAFAGISAYSAYEEDTGASLDTLANETTDDTTTDAATDSGSTDIGGGTGANNFNAVWAEFRINESVLLDSLGDTGSDVTRYQFQRYLGDIQLTYYFLEGEDATYSGMAKLYGELLFGDEEASTTPSEYYSTVEMVGLINGYGLFFGVEYNDKISMTSFDQVETIAKDLKSNGFNNMNIKLNGWFNGGVEHGFIQDIKVSKQLGGEDGFKDLISSLESENIGLYPDADFQNVYTAEDTPSNKYTASNISGETSYIQSYDMVNFSAYDKLTAAVLNMDAARDNLSSFMEDYSEYGLNNVSFRSLGAKISANYKEKEDYMERQETLETLQDMVKTNVADKGYSVMGNGAFAPYIQYMDVVNNMPVESAGLDTCDYSVPFTSMVLSGHVDYTYKPINLSYGERKDLLRLIEGNAGAYFTLTGEFYDEIGWTDYDYLYSTCYDQIKDSVLEKYNYVSTALTDAYGVAITNHEHLAENVNKVTYANGNYIIVNYGSSDYKTSDGITVPANGYINYFKDVKGAE